MNFNDIGLVFLLATAIASMLLRPFLTTGRHIEQRVVGRKRPTQKTRHRKLGIATRKVPVRVGR